MGIALPRMVDEPVSRRDRQDELAALLLPHLDAAYDLARWLVRHDRDAEDVVQEAYLRAVRYADSLLGTDGRPWLLAIVRNTALTFLRRRGLLRSVPLESAPETVDETTPDPEVLALAAADRTRVRHALDALPVEFREVLVLRELEGLSYKEIAAVIDAPIGTVMSRLARARERLHRALRRSGEED